MTTHMKAPSATYSLSLCGAYTHGDSIDTRWENVTCENCQDVLVNKKQPDPVLGLPAHSPYKDAGGISIKDVIEAKLTPEQLDGYYLGCAIDYLLCCNFKHDGKDFIKDVSKANDYINWLIEADCENQS